MSEPKDRPPTQSSPSPEMGDDATSHELADSAAHVAAIQAELHDMKDRYLRAVADTENLRKRADRERVEAAQFAIQRFAKDLLEVADNFRRALVTLSSDARKTLPPQIDNLLTGIEATEHQMYSVFERHALKRLDPKGEKFDPNYHQAIAEAPDPQTPEGHVSEVAQSGFTLAGRLIRPAMVVVSKGAHLAEAPRSNGATEHTGRLDTKA